MLELIYKKIYVENTTESKKADNCLTQKIKLFLDGKQLENLGKEEVEELVYVAGSIGHEEGFKCAIEFLRKLFAALFPIK